MKKIYLGVFLVCAVGVAGLLANRSGVWFFSAPVSEHISTAPDTGEQPRLSEDGKSEGVVAEPPVEAISEERSEEPISTALPAPVDSKFSFAIVGDTQRFNPENANGGFQKAVRNITAKNVAFLMTEGDLLSSCGDGCGGNLATWKSVLGSLASRTYELMGNHDRTGRSSSDSVWRNTFTLPTNGPDEYRELVYSFDFQNTHLVVLNSEKPKGGVVDNVQRDWLEKDLSSTTKDNIFVFFHEPAYPVSSKIGSSLDAHKDERDALWNIFVAHKVTAVFNGHEHIHSRKKVNTVYQFVFGNTDSFDHDVPKSGMAEFSYRGKTFGIVDVEGKRITVNVYSVEGNLINSFTFSH